MRICHVVGITAYGSLERQLEHLAAALKTQGHAQQVMLAGDPERAARFRAVGVDVAEITFSNWFSFLDRRRINADVRRFEPDVVVSWKPEMSAMVEEGPYVHLGYVGETFPLGAYANCDHLMAAAGVRTGRAAAAGWSADKLHVIPHLPPASAETPGIPPLDRRKHYTPQTSKLILTAARLKHAKGVDVLIDALTRLSGYYLWIAGDGPDRAALEARALEKGVKPRVRFLGWLEDLAPLLKACDVFVYPARQEELSDPVVEAWAAGAPIIAADSLGPGLLIRHKENGLLVPVNDAANLAEAIKWLAHDAALARRLTESGRLAFRETFAADKIRPQYLDLFTRLVAKPTPPPAA